MGGINIEDSYENKVQDIRIQIKVLRNISIFEKRIQLFEFFLMLHDVTREILTLSNHNRTFNTYYFLDHRRNVANEKHC